MKETGYQSLLHQKTQLLAWEIVRLNIICIILANGIFSDQALAENIQFPEGAFSISNSKNSVGLINIKKTPYNAVGDGATDDTLAIQQAIHDHVGKARIIYFPQGTYLVSNTLEGLGPQGQGLPALILHGQGQERSIIKLKDNSPGFQDLNHPKPLIKTRGISKSRNENNRAFRNSLYFLSVDTGSGNPGAIGLDYRVSNRGTIRNVTIRSSDASKRGIAGITMFHEPGPGLLANVTIDGFDYGIDTKGLGNSITIDGLRLHNQKLAGIRSQNQVLSIRQLKSNNTVPSILQTGKHGLITLIDSFISNPAQKNTGVWNVEEAKLFVRTLQSTGYRKVIDNHRNALAPDVVGNSAKVLVSEWVSHKINSLFNGPQQSLNLPIQEAPTYHTNDFSRWANVVQFGATPTNNSDDDGPAIQAAIDSGAEIIYFPRGSYKVGSSITVRHNARRIIGFESNIIGPSASSNINPLLRLDETSGSFVILEQFNFGGSIEHNSPRTLVLRDIKVGDKNSKYSYRNTKFGTGKLHLENIILNAPMELKYGQKVWARQLDAERKAAMQTGVRILNDGSSLWILGMKNEGRRTIIKTINNGYTEVLGNLIYPAGDIPHSEDVAFINHESSISLVYTELTYKLNRGYVVHVEEIRSGNKHQLLSKDLLSRRFSRIVPLFVGYRGEAPNSSERLPVRHQRENNFLNVLCKLIGDFSLFE